jgi:hypothetical protein
MAGSLSARLDLPRVNLRRALLAAVNAFPDGSPEALEYAHELVKWC